MTSTKKRVAGIAVAVATLAFIGAPANAVAPPIADPSGVDFDPACVKRNPAAAVGAANNVPSPGANANCLVGTYDNSTETTDLRAVNLSSVGGQLVAEFTVDGAIPAAGNVVPPPGSADLPDNKYVGFGYKAMFQNPDLQNNTPYIAGLRFGTNKSIYGLNEHHEDGFHFFVGFIAEWDGTKWVHRAQIGTYNPDPDGGFIVDELGTSSAPGVWTNDDPTCFTRAAGDWDVVYGPGNKVTVKVKGVVKFSTILAAGLCVESWYAKPNNGITNVKGLSTVHLTVARAAGFMVDYSDATEGNSTNFGLAAAMATASGDKAATPCINEGLQGNRPCVSYTRGMHGRHDTEGRGPRCWTPTADGLGPPNPNWVPNQPCHIDDDSRPGPNGNVDPGDRGTFNAEFWDTNYGFTF